MLSQDLYCGWQGKLMYQPTPDEAEGIERDRQLGLWPKHQTHLFTRFRPMLRERGLTDDEIFPLLDENPRRFFSGTVLSEA